MLFKSPHSSSESFGFVAASTRWREGNLDACEKELAAELTNGGRIVAKKKAVTAVKKAAKKSTTKKAATKKATTKKAATKKAATKTATKASGAAVKKKKK